MIFHLATILLLVLKLAGVIAWSWWLVFLPSLAVFAWVFLLASIVAAVTAAVFRAATR